MSNFEDGYQEEFVILDDDGIPRRIDYHQDYLDLIEPNIERGTE